MDGKALPVMTKLHEHKFKRAFPTMAGIIGVIAVAVVTYVCNWDRGQTWLPLFGFCVFFCVSEFVNVCNHNNFLLLWSLGVT